MNEKFLDILGELWGTDIAYQEDSVTISLILDAMKQSYYLGRDEVDFDEPEECEHEYKHEHTTWCKCTKCGHVTVW